MNWIQLAEDWDQWTLGSITHKGHAGSDKIRSLLNLEYSLRYYFDLIHNVKVAELIHIINIKVHYEVWLQQKHLNTKLF